MLTSFFQRSMQELAIRLDLLQLHSHILDFLLSLNPLIIILNSIFANSVKRDLKIVNFLVFVTRLGILNVEFLNQLSQLSLFLLHVYVISFQIIIFLFRKHCVQLYIEIFNHIFNLLLRVNDVLPVFI